MNPAGEGIPGYTYGTSAVAGSTVSLQELDMLKISAGFTQEDERYLQLAGTVLQGRTAQIVQHWRNEIIASIPNLARHSRSPEGEAIPQYLANSNLRFEQWILDTCFRPYDQDWANYQQEIALRHTSVKKNRTDAVQSTPYVPLRDIIGFMAVINETIKPYLAVNGHAQDDVDRMHRAWCKSMQIQLALWAAPYADGTHAPNEW
jgi:Protoglobin